VKKKMETEARLRALLREGDPLGDQPELPPEEVRDLRRTILRSIPSPLPARRPRLALALALAAVAAGLALGLALIFQLTPTSPAPPRVAAVAPPAPSASDIVPTPPGRALAPRASTPELPKTAESRTRPAAVRLPKTAGSSAATEIAAADTVAATFVAAASGAPLAPTVAPASRQIQFETPGGTRVLWVLAPAGP
jgi:hypothetical protein